MAKCIICGNHFSKDTLLYGIENMPASAQNIPTYEECKNENSIALYLHQCPMCGLVQFDVEPVDYYRDVIRAGGGSSTMINLRKYQYEKFINMCDLSQKKIVEIGAGKGEFLNILNEYDVSTFGIEHNQKYVDEAKKKGINIVHGFAENENTIIQGAPFDAFTSFNFLEHQPDPNGMLKAIYNNLTVDGVGLITVPSFEYILKYDGFYELIRDHLAYYTFDTLTFLLNKNGFEVIDKEIVNRDTLAVIVKKRSKIGISSLADSYDSLKKEILNYIEKFEKENKKVAIWGASHQGFTLASTLELKNKISYIIDSAVFKQGKYAPGSHIPIVSPEHYYADPVHAIIIVAPGYTNEITDIIRNKYGKNINLSTLKSNHLEILCEEKLE